MKHLLKLIKGISIGIANIIPGFSGGTMAVIVKVYDEFVEALANLTKTPILVIKKSWSLFLGIVIGMVVGFLGIVKLLEVVPLLTILFFFGLVLGSIPYQAKIAIQKPFNKWTLISFFVALGIIIVLPIIAGSNPTEVDEMTWMTYFVVFMLGLASAAAMVLPGLSGSMILLIFGYYHYILNLVKTLFEGIVKFQFSGLGEPFLITIILIFGIVVGIIGMSKLVQFLYKKYPNFCNMAVLGLLVASLFAILYSSNTSFNGSLFNAKVWQWIAGVILALMGCGVAYCMNYYGTTEEKSVVQLNDVEQE